MSAHGGRSRPRGRTSTSSRSGSREAIGALPGRRRAGRAATRSPPAGSGCGRCSSSSTSDDRERALRGGVAVELVHMATLVHDDLIDGARAPPRARRRLDAHGADAARAAGDYLFARAFAELAEAGDLEAVRSSPTPACRSPAARRSSAARCTTPTRPIEAYLERCALKTGKLFEAACLLGSRDERLGEFGLALGIAFQIADDILDCAGDTIETGKIAGTDLREGTPTLPLLLAARRGRGRPATRSPAARSTARSLRVAATGALERSAKSRSTTLDQRARVPRRRRP